MFQGKPENYLKIYVVKVEEEKGCSMELRGTNHFGDTVKVHIQSKDHPSLKLVGAMEKLAIAVFKASDLAEETIADVVSVKFTVTNAREMVEVLGRRSCSDLEGNAEVKFPPQFIGGTGAIATITRAAKDVKNLAGDYAFGKDRPNNMFAENEGE